MLTPKKNSSVGLTRAKMKKYMVGILILTIQMVEQEYAATSLITSRNFHVLGFSVGSVVSLCLRGGGDTTAFNITAKVLNVLEMREAAMNSKCDCSSTKTTTNTVCY